MGHYASEMACPTCHQCRCTCPPPADTTRDHWVIESDYSVMRAHEFEAKHSFIHFSFAKLPDKTAGHVRRMGKKHYESRAEAEAEAVVKLRAALVRSEETTAELTARLQELAPPPAPADYRIDISQPVSFYDDRSKTDAVLRMVKVLFASGTQVLCEAAVEGDDARFVVLFDRTSREVLTSEFQFWMASNA